MRRCLVGPTIALNVVLAFALGVRAQAQQWNSIPPDKSTYAGEKARPAPRRDLSGLWDGTAEGGVQPYGVREYVLRTTEDMSHDVPYTPLGKTTFKANKPGAGPTSVPAALVNDPVDYCEPQGFPRMELYELRVVEITQTKQQVIYLDQFYQNFRIIWTDGRPLPKDPEARWFGYSVGKWTDDYTFEVDTVGMDDRTWLDNVGRPHSSDMRVHEVYHRVDNDTLELSVTIDDPKVYAKPWVALNKIALHRLPDNFDMREFLCSPSETQEYNKLVADPAAEGANK